MEADKRLAKRVAVCGADACKIVSASGEINHLLLNVFSAVFRYLPAIKENAICIAASLNPRQSNIALVVKRSTSVFQ